MCGGWNKTAGKRLWKTVWHPGAETEELSLCPAWWQHYDYLRTSAHFRYALRIMQGTYIHELGFALPWETGEWKKRSKENQCGRMGHVLNLEWAQWASLILSLCWVNWMLFSSFWDWVSLTPGWPQTLYAAHNLKHLALLLDLRVAPSLLVLCCAGDQTQALLHSRWSVCQLTSLL